jgi:hypothetical protein
MPVTGTSLATCPSELQSATVNAKGAPTKEPKLTEDKEGDDPLLLS